MLKKLRTFFAALLLVPALTLNAHAFTTPADDSGFSISPPQQVTGVCWIYWMGRWWQLPC